MDENGRAESSEHGRDDLSSVVSDVSIDQSKAARKKLKKLRQRLSELSEEYSSGMDQVPAYMRRDSNVPKLLALIRRGGGPQGIERQLTQLALIVNKPEVFDFQCLWLLDGLGVLANIVQKSVEPNSDVSRKALITAVQVYRNSCSLCPQIARHAILGNSITILLDALLHSLQVNFILYAMISLHFLAHFSIAFKWRTKSDKLRHLTCRKCSANIFSSFFFHFHRNDEYFSRFV